MNQASASLGPHYHSWMPRTQNLAQLSVDRIIGCTSGQLIFPRYRIGTFGGKSRNPENLLIWISSFGIVERI